MPVAGAADEAREEKLEKALDECRAATAQGSKSKGAALGEDGLDEDGLTPEEAQMLADEEDPLAGQGEGEGEIDESDPLAGQ